MPALRGSPDAWRDRIRQIEDLGFSSVAISDHFANGWIMDPIVAMSVAAEASTHLRVSSLVLCNDFRHPVLLHKSMANLDVFSGGRLELGLGAGWLRDDHDAAGLAFDPPGVRIDRLSEAIEVIVRLFADRPATFVGKHYQVTDLDGLPKPVQRPHPPLAIGGGSRRILELAGRVADIVAINVSLGRIKDPGQAAVELSAARLSEKVAWARAGAAVAGRDVDALEFQISLLDLRVTHGGVEHRSTSSLAAHASPEDLAASAVALHGTVDECADKLLALREAHGISYFHLGSDLDAAAPIVARLAGR
jgi:probable F420-dependent oxidoreductase